MQAILELLFAMIGGLAAAFFGLLVAAAQLALFTVEILFVAVTQGFSRAKERARETRSRRTTREEELSAVSNEEFPASPSPRLPAWTYVGLFGVLVAVVVGSYVSSRIRAARIENAKNLVDRWANDVANTIARGNAPPDRGELPIQDPWQQPLELFLDDFAVGTLVVVRSAGPDQRTGTIDDLLGIRMQQKPVKQLAGEVGDLAVDQVKEQVLKLLKRERKEDP